jgi:hypothetical protein
MHARHRKDNRSTVEACQFEIPGDSGAVEKLGVWAVSAGRERPAEAKKVADAN